MFMINTHSFYCQVFLIIYRIVGGVWHDGVSTRVDDQDGSGDKEDFTTLLYKNELVKSHLIFKNTRRIFPATESGPDFVVFFRRDRGLAR